MKNDFQVIKYIERKTTEIKIEKVPAENFLKFLYYNPFGKLCLNLLIKRKILSYIYGKFMDKEKSKNKIQKFIDELSIDMTEVKKSLNDFNNFNEFFYRELKDGARKIDYDSKKLVSPADGKILVFENINELTKFYVKGQSFNLKKFLNDEDLAKKYDGGTFVIIRLAPVDYHRLHFPCDGTISKTTLINGYYFSVSPHAIRNNFNIFLENKREISILKNDLFGDVALIEVAATMVGGIKQTYRTDTFVKKGEEKSYFYFGGSSIVLLFEKDKIKFDDDLIENTRNNIETKIYMGETIAHEK